MNRVHTSITTRKRFFLNRFKRIASDPEFRWIDTKRLQQAQITSNFQKCGVLLLELFGGFLGGAG